MSVSSYPIACAEPKYLYLTGAPKEDLVAFGLEVVRPESRSTAPRFRKKKGRSTTLTFAWLTVVRSGDPERTLRTFALF